MKSLLSAMAIALFLFSPLRAQKATWAYAPVAEHLSVKFPVPPEKKTRQYEMLSAEHKKGVYKVFCTAGSDTDSLISFQAFTDSVMKNAGKCSGVSYKNSSVNNDSIVYLDLILADSERSKEGSGSKTTTYLRVFEYGNNLYCLRYSEPSSKINKSVFTKNKFFTSIVYKPDLNSRRRGVNITMAKGFASFISCAPLN